MRLEYGVQGEQGSSRPSGGRDIIVRVQNLSLHRLHRQGVGQYEAGCFLACTEVTHIRLFHLRPFVTAPSNRVPAR